MSEDLKQNPTKGAMSKGSIYAIVAVLAIALVVSLVIQITSPKAGDGPIAKVTAYNQVVALMPLSADARQTIETDEGVNTIVVEGGAVHIEDADCAGGDCMRQGSISQTHELLVCLPHSLIVEIIPGAAEAGTPSVYTGNEAVGSSEIDAVAR